MLVERGTPADEAVTPVRRRRSAWALGATPAPHTSPPGFGVAPLLVGPDPRAWCSGRGRREADVR